MASHAVPSRRRHFRAWKNARSVASLWRFLEQLVDQVKGRLSGRPVFMIPNGYNQAAGVVGAAAAGGAAIEPSSAAGGWRRRRLSGASGFVHKCL